MPPKPPLTHFLCLPLVTASSRPLLEASIARFKSGLTSADDARSTSIPPKAIRPVGALHFTLGVMSLDARRLEAACTFLQSLNLLELLKESIAADSDGTVKRDIGGQKDIEATGSDASPFKMTLAGLHAMQSPNKTSSLYIAPPEISPALTPFCIKLQAAFRDAGFLIPESRAFKLHATVVNTIYAREAKSGKKRWSKDSGKIDATELIERYKDYEWLKDTTLDRIAICEMGAKKIMEGEEVVDQVYTEVASVPLL